MPAKHGLEIDGGASKIGTGCNDLEALQQFPHLRRGRGLGSRDDDILSTLLAPAALIQHPERLSDARGVSQEDLELSPVPVPLFRLHPLEKLLRAGAAIVAVGHISLAYPHSTPPGHPSREVPCTLDGRRNAG